MIIIQLLDLVSFSKSNVSDIALSVESYKQMISRSVLAYDCVYDFIDRKACYEKIRDSVVAAVTIGKKKQKPAHASSSTRTASGDISLDQQFRDAICKHHSSVEIAWEAFDSISEPRGTLSRYRIFQSHVDVYISY